jgi:16S rRNA processing protein RimM
MNNLIPVGIIVNTHGLKGTLKVKSDSDFKESRFRVGNKLFIGYQNTYVPVTVKRYQSKKGLEYIDFEEFTHINDCEKYKRCELFIRKEDRDELQEGEYYFDELIGMTVILDNQKGTVKDVRDMPQGAILEVALATKTILIPFHKEFIQDVDREKGVITISMWEGLL